MSAYQGGVQPPGSEPQRPAANAAALAVILACQLMLVLDGTVIYAALPHLRADFGLARADLSWVQNAYMLTFGGFMLLGARTGDLLGHRRVFLAASAAFVVTSSAAGLAQSLPQLLIARGLQGMAGAFAAPSALALLMLCFPQGASRVRAISLYTAVSGGGSAAGLVLGGALTDFASWRWVLFINVPIGVLLLRVGLRCLPDPPRHRGYFDCMGALAVTLGIGLLVYGLVHGEPAEAGNSGATVALSAAGLFLAAFILIEKRARQPITPLALFANAQRSGAYAGKMLLIGGMLGTFFFLTQYAQEVLAFSAFHAGLAFVPLSVAQFLMVIVGVPRLMPRLGSKRLLTAGLLIAAAGMMCLSRVEADSAFFADLALPIVMLGIGSGAALVPLTTAGIDGVAPRDAGAASGLINATHYLGGAIGTAAVVFVVDLTLGRAALTHGRELSGSASQWVAKTELTHALSVAASTSAAFFVLALCIALVTMRRPHPVPMA